ncbi:serine/arginine repetitive matrix protein 3-like [Sapajus apella]|uniref:Serine/arginine repetitive matrix protein 3-like n=1 Tax=Sapajus apella TaxID=9515 RepID=A0A6J3IL97_SAPAP|nr:serine/arginine repetitive matrix protein 3-like [Sapajus apella]
MAEGSAATAAAASAPRLRAGGRGGGRPWGRKAEGGRRRAGGGRGGGRRGKGRARRPRRRRGFPASLALVRPALARPLLVPAPRLASPQPPALAAPPPALRAGAPLPPSSCASASFHTNTNSSARAQISPPPPPPHSARAGPRETSALASARPASLPLARSPSRSSFSANRSARWLPRPRPLAGLLLDWGRWDRGRGRPHARWLAGPRRVTSARRRRCRCLPPLGVARLPPSAVQQPQNALPRARAALGSGVSPLQPPPREPM